MRAVFLIEYDGTDFSGWQIQPSARTVQGELQKAALLAFGQNIKFTASGRTDAGVHASGQVAQADLETNVPAGKLRECLNGFLPSDVKILKSAEAPEDFDCTRCAKKKTYTYSAYYAESGLPLLNRYAARLPRKPDVERMRSAAELLKGEHDFAAFRAAGYTSKTSVRTVTDIAVREECGKECFLYSVTVTGNGFLYHMVRIIAGELFAIGCGKEEGVTEAFQTGKRSALGKTMPPQGLTLENVDYGDPLFGEERPETGNR